MSLSNLISYYKSCYQADNRTQILNNFLSNSKVEHRKFVEGAEEMLTGFLPHLPIEEEYAQTLKKTISIYQKEKELVYCSFFILGKEQNFGKRVSKIVAPLFIYPAEIIKQNDLYYIKADLTEQRINFEILNQIHEDNDNNSKFFEELFNIVQNKDLDLHLVADFTKILNKYIDNLDTSQLFTYPELYPEKKLKRLTQPANLDENNFKIVPASGIGIVKKSPATLGVINELNEICRSNSFSHPIHAIFEGAKFKYSEAKLGYITEGLNSAQLKILKNANTFPFNIVNGPPGTGKTYTIAKLALSQMIEGKSVLIASRTDQAVDVIAQKIEEDLLIDGVVMRAGKSRYLRDLKKTLSNILNGVVGTENPDLSKVYARKIRNHKKELVRLESIFKIRVLEETRWGHLFANQTKNPITAIRKKYISWSNVLKKTHWEIIQELEFTLKNIESNTEKYVKQKYLEQIHQTLLYFRNDLANFLKALKARRGAKKEQLFEQTDFKVILKTFPIWMVKMSDISSVLPLKPELFDIAIIDEATQCDIASSIPILQRAKKVIIAGDPNQLRHVSFLSKTKQNLFAQQNNITHKSDTLLNYRENSILDIFSDAVSNQEQITFLDEHYRSLPSIINFSNKNFYSSALKIMTSRPDLSYNEGITVEQTNGVRNKGINEQEAQRIIEKISQIVDSEYIFTKQNCSSIGILSPFRTQADFLSELVSDNFDLETIEKHNISVGTAYSFQGEERDIMLISFVLDNSSHPMAFRHINKHEVFNVSITRARAKQHIFHSLDLKQLKTDSLLRKYLESFSSKVKIRKFKIEKDKFTKEVEDFLIEEGYKTWVGYMVAGQKIDIIFQKRDGIAYAIDLIGYQGEFFLAFSIERYKMLSRAGLKIFPLPFTYWAVDSNHCKKQIKMIFRKQMSKPDAS